MEFAKSGIQRMPIQTVLAIALLVAASPAEIRAAEQGLVLIGYNATYFGDTPMQMDGSLMSDAFCGNEGVSAMVNANQAVFDRVSQRLGGLDLPTQSEMESTAAAAQTKLCQGGQGFQLEPSTITYSACRLNMDQQATLMDMRIPSSGVDGAMEVADFWKAEVMRIPLYESGSGGAGNASQWDVAINWSGPGDSAQLAGYPATRWDFDYATTMNIGAAAGMGMSMNMATTGYGYFSRDVPGFDLLEDFYEAFSQGISFEEGGGSFFGGMMNTWVEMLERGVPLEMDQTVTSSMGGMGSAGGSSRSFLKISSVQLVDLPDGFCTMMLTPDYFEVTDAGAGLAGMSMGPGSNTPGAAAPGQEGVPSLDSIMEMFKSGGQQGFAVPGQQQAPAANPAGQPAAQAPAGASSGATPRSGPSSGELMTDNVTQSVQMHLQALGYEVGNTNGDMDTTTVIAISQFQAEKGMEVTGEASPQLLGILGAEVDAR